MSAALKCPNCETDLRGEQIPGTGGFFSKAVDLTVTDARGEPVGWGARCPQCSFEWPYPQAVNTVVAFASFAAGAEVETGTF